MDATRSVGLAAAVGGAVLGGLACSACRGKRRGARRAGVYRVAVTGGPCAGKSSGMAHVQEKLQAEGYNVYVVPEAATLLIGGGGGLMLREPNEAKILEFQLQLLKLQMQLEENFTTFAEAEGKPAVVLCDRGVLDGKAFCTDAQWDWLMKKGSHDTGTEWSQAAFHRRYDMCLHFTTAAKGAEQFYTTANNSARTETVEEAREQDDKLLEAWAGHSHHRVVPNQSHQFVKKLEDGMSHIFNLIGLTPPVAFKYKLNAFSGQAATLPTPHTTAMVSHHVLRGSTTSLVYRLCHKQDPVHGHDVCSHQVLKTSFDDDGVVYVTKTEEQIGMPAYNNMLAMKDPSYETVVVATTSFAFHGKRYELHQVVRPAGIDGETTLIAYDYHDQTSLAELMQALGSDVAPVRMSDEDYAKDVQQTLLIPVDAQREHSAGVGTPTLVPTGAGYTANAPRKLSLGKTMSSVQSEGAPEQDAADLPVEQSYATIHRAITSPCIVATPADRQFDNDHVLGFNSSMHIRQVDADSDSVSSSDS